MAAHFRKENHTFFVASMGDSLVPSKNQWDLVQAFDANCEKEMFDGKRINTLSQLLKIC